MAFEPGDVVFLKSGGQSMTVASVDEDSVECLWLGEEGELFRETVPSVVLTAAPTEDLEDEDEEHHEDAEDEDEEEEEDADEDEDEDEDKPAKSKRG
ncbi:MAG: hypothetical protein QOI40_3393 [Alphaproteobacteria bacterium]|jgi:uncharacterized protein YodC (DUF2158 family)|nr:hypothetical protein [Alphaproteobacteria bacterium]